MNDLINEARSGFGAESLRHPTRASSMILLAFDVAATGLALVVFDWTLERGIPFLAVLFAILLVRGHYRTRMRRDGGEDASILISSIAMAGLLGLLVVAVLDVVEPLVSTVAAASLGLFLILMLSRWAAFSIVKVLRRRGHIRSRAVVVGTAELAREIGIEFGHRVELGVDIAGFVAVDGVQVERALPGPIIGNVADLASLCRLTGSDRVIVTGRDPADHRVIDAIRSLRPGTVSVFVMPQLFELGLGSNSMTPDSARGYSLVRLGRSAHPALGLRFKRLFDVVVASLALVVLAPVLVVAALLVKLTSRGPVLFRQVRVGRDLERFELLKVRTMTVNDDSDVSWTPDSSDAGVTRLGRFLRWSGIDELPQLWNIVRGDMSIVGPRPERPVFVEHFLETVSGYQHRHRMPVGLTGLAQVRGLRGDTPLAERVKADNLYIDQWSFFGDLRIIAGTITSILRQRQYAEAEISLDAAVDDRTGGESVVIDLVEAERIASDSVTRGA